MRKKVQLNKPNSLIKTQNALFIQRRLSSAMINEKKKLEEEGCEVPNTTLYVEADTRMIWSPEKYFNKNYSKYMEEIKAKYGLTVTEIGIIYTLSFYISYENNLLSLPNGNPLRKVDLPMILDLGENAVDKYMAGLVQKGVLAKVKVRRSVNYYLNPRICYQGNRIDKTLLTMFHIY